MFGTYRTVLAMGVVAQHLAGVTMTGNYAVFGFYILSGYLMTYIMQRNYGYSATGTIRYATNRFLRIYPTYWAATLTSVVLILLLGEQASTAYHDAIFLPATLTETLRNLFLVLPYNFLPRLTPPAWALTVELFFYILIGLGLSRGKLITSIWFIAAVGYHVIGSYMGLSYGERYYPVYAAAMPFATGAMIYHFSDDLSRWVRSPGKFVDQYLPLLLLCAMGISWFLGNNLHLWYVKGAGFYINYVLCALMVLVLIERPLLPVIPKWLDAKIGDLSYPIYLIHLQMGMIVFTALGVMGFDFKRMDWRLFLLALPLVLLSSWLLNIAVSHPVDRVREAVKKANLARSKGVSQA